MARNHRKNSAPYNNPDNNLQRSKRNSRRRNRNAKSRSGNTNGNIPAGKNSKAQFNRKSVTPDLRRYRVSSPARAFIWRWKYVALVLIVATALHTVVSVVASEGLGNVSVIVAKTEIAVGETFNTNNTAIRLYPESAVPDNALESIAAVSGKTASATISQGLPITTKQILDDQYLADAPNGTVVTSVILRDDISAQLLQPGNHVELYAPASAKGQPAKLLASDAVIIGKPTGKVKSSILGEVADNTAVYVAIKKRDADVILGLQTETPLQAVIVSV